MSNDLTWSRRIEEQKASPKKGRRIMIPRNATPACNSPDQLDQTQRLSVPSAFHGANPANEQTWQAPASLKKGCVVAKEKDDEQPSCHVCGAVTAAVAPFQLRTFSRRIPTRDAKSTTAPSNNIWAVAWFCFISDASCRQSRC